ncbi:MAG: PLP-dependent cysteine synthase family protein [Desulfurococcaceae archaeon]
MKLIELSSVRGEFIKLEDYLNTLESILRNWASLPVLIDNNNVVVDNLDVYNALWAMGVRLIPVTTSRDELSMRISLNELGVYDDLTQVNPRIYNDVIELVKRDIPTPMVKLKSLSTKNTRVWAKLEWYHPFSLSIKDRIAWYMLTNALERGLIKGGLIYEATSTNTGLGLVGMANYYGLKTRIYLPSTAQKCVDYVFKAMGADVVRLPAEFTTELLNQVVNDAIRDNATVLNQFENDLNFIAHLKYTAKEIDYQLLTKGIKPSSIISGVGTSGHLSALSLYFKSKYGDVKVYGVQPRKGSIIPGIRRLETGMKWIHMVKVDKLIDVSLEEAFQAILHVSRNDGLLVGLSAGAVIYATRELIENNEIEGDVVIIVPDHGIKYIELLEYLVEKCVETPAEYTERLGEPHQQIQ